MYFNLEIVARVAKVNNIWRYFCGVGLMVKCLYLRRRGLKNTAGSIALRYLAKWVRVMKKNYIMVAVLFLASPSLAAFEYSAESALMAGTAWNIRLNVEQKVVRTCQNGISGRSIEKKLTGISGILLFKDDGSFDMAFRDKNGKPLKAVGGSYVQAENQITLTPPADLGYVIDNYLFAKSMLESSMGGIPEKRRINKPKNRDYQIMGNLTDDGAGAKLSFQETRKYIVSKGGCKVNFVLSNDYFGTK